VHQNKKTQTILKEAKKENKQTPPTNPNSLTLTHNFKKSENAEKSL